MKKNQGKFIVGLLLVIVVVIFSVININEVSVNFGFAVVKIPLVVLILITFCLGVVSAYLVSWKDRRSDKKKNNSNSSNYKNVNVSSDTEISDALNKSNSNDSKSNK